MCRCNIGSSYVAVHLSKMEKAVVWSSPRKCSLVSPLCADEVGAVSLEGGRGHMWGTQYL